MATSTLDLAARLRLDSSQWTQGLNTAAQRTRGFASTVKQSFAGLHAAMDTTVGKLAAIGGGFSAVSTIVKSAQVDRQLTMIKQTATLSAEQTRILRGELKAMSTETGTAFESLQEGFGGLVAGGQTFGQALPTMDAINKTMRVTGAQANTLVQALLMAQTHFDFDLSKAGEAQYRLDQMTVAGRAGVVEIEDLSQAFAASAANAKRAGLTFEETLALYEGFGTATTKDRLGTLVNSTLAVFTNANYMKEAQKATGVRFFDAKGERRGALEVIADIKKAYDKLSSDKDRFSFITKAFGKADKDTVIGINEALKEGKLEQILTIAEQARGASGTIARDLPESMNNAVAQANVLRERMGAAADAFAMPLNAAFTEASKLLLGKREDGGLELTDKQLAAGGLLTLGGLFAGKKMASGALSKLLGGGASLATGVAMGEALEQTGAATPVFIVGAAPGVFSGVGVGLPGGGPAAGGRAAGNRVGTGGLLARGATALGTSGVGALAGGGAAGLSKLLGGVGLAGAAGWGVGTLANEHLISGTAFGDMIGESIAKAMAALGSEEARSAVNASKKLEMMIQLSDERARITLRSPDADTSMSVRQSVNLGAMMRPPSVVN